MKPRTNNVKGTLNLKVTAVNYAEMEMRVMAEINKIANEVGTTWKTKRALLRQLGVEDPLLSELVPMGGRASDY